MCSDTGRSNMCFNCRAHIHYLIVEDGQSTLPETQYINNISDLPKEMNKIANASVSILAKKSSQELSRFSWVGIVGEMKQRFPLLLIILCGIMLGATSSYQSILPQLGMIYGIVMKTRNKELSLVQHMMSVCLYDTVSNVKVFDRLHKCGISMSYSHTQTIVQKYSKVTFNTLVEAVKKGKYVRFIGDNLNFFTNIPANTEGHLTQPELVYKGLCNFVDDMIYPSFSGKGHPINGQSSERVLRQTFELKLANGKSVFLQKQVREEVIEEKV